MSTQDEIRAVFDHWAERSATMDLDGSMEVIAPDIVSFEHGIPLVHRGVEEVREECQYGFDAMAKMDGEFSWRVDPLTVIDAGNFAISWGINHMVVTRQDAEVYHSTSRGTWIFERQSLGWRLVHQHQSYPYDPATGKAETTAAE